MMGRHDWEIVAADEPYFGVLVHDKFRKSALTPQSLDEFYESGRAELATVSTWLQAATGAQPAGRVLELGCGVGRHSLAFAEAGFDVVGYDVSQTMLARARERLAQNPSGKSVRFTTELPDGPFDWLHSFIVLQHIPPDEGLRLLCAALSRLAPGAFLSIQVTIWRDRRLSPSGLKRRIGRQGRLWLARLGLGPAAHLIQMYDYDLGALARACVAAGFANLALRHTDHGGHHGVWMLGRKG
jgi:SAM-dependent methyltransferase